ncbi:tyrosine-type recombinase/integrase [Rubellicoccus peritrichatus]|uniref:tyrosine-type recombinase/integrase n=1 Tax=Rubellicoccus peritrichatus TaxID=3080537 RepID=UPI003CE4E85C
MLWVRKVDFHALRYTFATRLARNGVSQRLAQELMRHSDLNLTARIYTDASQLPTFSTIESLPFENQSTGTWTQIGTQKPDFSGLSQSQTVKINYGNNNSETIDNKVDSLNLSGADTHCPMVPGEGLEPSHR